MQEATLRKVSRRLIPFIALLYAFNILDRTNISVASLTMKPDLGFSDTVYGLGAGVFFLGYFLFEVPSNLILERVGARKWIARILVTWGAVSAAMLFVKTAPVFYGMRFLLGLAEAGFYPGIILYLTYWFPTAQRAQAVARFVAVSALVGIIGGPLSGALLKLDGLLGMKGWQWLFLLEGLPSCLLGTVALRYLTDRPEKAEWLSADEKSWLVGQLDKERKEREQTHKHLSLTDAFKSPRLLHFALIFFLYVSAGYGVSFFAPQIYKSQTNWSAQTIALVAALPGIAGAISMLLTSAHSDRTGERKRYVAFGTTLAAIGVSAAALSPNAYCTLAALTVAEFGRGIVQGPFWAMPTSLLSGAAAAGGIAAINSIGNLGGFAGPYAMGWLKDRTHGYQTGLFLLAGLLICSAICALLVPTKPASKDK
jgi:MFS transporter, ACS family, tartrate transporter